MLRWLPRHFYWTMEGGYCLHSVAVALRSAIQSTTNKSVTLKPPYQCAADLMGPLHQHLKSKTEHENTTRQSIKCNCLSSVETGNQVAVILSLISSKTTVMQLGTTDDPWEWGTDSWQHLFPLICQHQAQRISRLQSFTGLQPWPLLQFNIRKRWQLFSALLPLWWDDHFSVYTLDLPSSSQCNNVLWKEWGHFIQKNPCRPCFCFTVKTF